MQNIGRCAGSTLENTLECVLDQLQLFVTCHDYFCQKAQRIHHHAMICRPAKIIPGYEPRGCETGIENLLR
jgi:hypothetical protein